MTGLTDRQREILRFICSHLARMLRPPTYREICEWAGVASTNGVGDHLKALEKKGYIDRAQYLGRSIRVLKDEDGRRPVVRFEFGQ